MLEALLAAREKLYISWVGRNVRDNSEQPPSVLLSQLRDYLARGWDLEPGLRQLTTEHPLQPFSRRYFEEGGLLTFAREWRVAHEDAHGRDAAAIVQGELLLAAAAGSAGLAAPELPASVSLADLARFLRQPVDVFFPPSPAGGVRRQRAGGAG